MSTSNRIWCCPFFGNGLTNETDCHYYAGTPDVRVKYNDRALWDRYCHDYCCDAKHWEDCTIAQLLIKTKGEEDET